MHRANITFEDKEWSKLERACKKLRPYQPVGTTIREILLHELTERNGLLRGVPNPGHSPASPSPPDPDPEEEKEKKKKEKKDPQLAPLEVTQRILDDLNERTGNNFQARGKVARRLIQAHLNEGYTEADFIEVNRKMARQWMGNSKMEHCLNYETLYGPRFEKYIGGKDVGPQRPLAFTEGEKRTERWERRKRPGYYTEQS